MKHDSGQNFSALAVPLSGLTSILRKKTSDPSVWIENFPRVNRTIFMVYLISGTLAGLAGVLWASRFESAQTNTALGFELQTVAASVVGGVSVLGGSGTVPGVILGAFLLGIINNALTLVRISPFWQLAAQGLLILLAVIVDFVISRQLQRMVAVRRRA